MNKYCISVMWLYMKPVGFCQLCKEAAAFSMPEWHKLGKPARMSGHGGTAGACQEPEECAHAPEKAGCLRYAERIAMACQICQVIPRNNCFAKWHTVALMLFFQCRLSHALATDFKWPEKQTHQASDPGE